MPSGRPKLTNAEIIQRKVWYQFVTNRSGKTLYRLDVLLDLDISAKTVRKAYGNRRRKIMEDLRDNDVMPFHGRLDQFLSNADNIDGLRGAQGLFMSPFWKLMDNSIPLDLKHVREHVVDCVIAMNLASRPGSYEDDQSSDSLEACLAMSPELTIEEFVHLQSLGDEAYDNALANALLFTEPNLDFIALLLLFVYEAILAGNRRIASDLVNVYQSSLKTYCEADWLGEMGKPLHSLGTSRMAELLGYDGLQGLPGYVQMLENSPQFNPGAPVVALLKRHQRLLWNR